MLITSVFLNTWTSLSSCCTYCTSVCTQFITCYAPSQQQQWVLRDFAVCKRHKRGLFTSFVVHQEQNIRPLSDHSKEFQHAGRSEGTPRTHLLTVKHLQGDLWGKKGKKPVSNNTKTLWTRHWRKTKEGDMLCVTFLTANLKPVLTSWALCTSP